MRILVIISEAPPIMSGVSRVGEEINSRLRAAGHTVDTLSSNDIPRVELGEVRLSSMLWKGIKPLFQRMLTYDIIHIHGPVPTFSDVALLFSALGRRAGRPRIVYTHLCEIELPGKEILCAPYNFMHRTLARLADHVVVSTPSYAASFDGYVPRNRVSVIPWGVHPHDRVEQKPDGLNILFVGQLRPYKGLDVLLRAACQVEHSHITVIGGGHRAEYYQDLAKKLGIERVRFLGQASDDAVRRAYAEAHTLVLPSLTKAEAFGLVLLEGMSAGCVPVASDLPGLTDVVGKVGYTFPAGDHDALADVLRRLSADRGALQSASYDAREWARMFSWDVAARRYEELFRRLAVAPASTAANFFPLYRPLRERAVHDPAD